MIVYVIEVSGAEGPPVYYDPGAGRNTGHGILGWTQVKDEALGFASPQDAQRMIDALLPRTASTCRPVPHRRA